MRGRDGCRAAFVASGVRGILAGMAVLMSTASTVQSVEPFRPTGASLAWTSDDPVVLEARALVEEGTFARAEAVLDASLGAEGGGAETGRPDGGGAQAVRAREEMREIIRRLRNEYRLTLDDMVAILRRDIPDIEAADVERWREAGEIQWRMIDGEPRYFRREPSNLWRFSEEAKRRRDAHAGEADEQRSRPAFDLHAHLAEVIAAAEETGREAVLPVRHRVTYRVTVPGNRRGAEAGSLLRCWLPFPQVYRQQGDVRLISASPGEPVIAPNAVDAWPLGGAPQRSVYLEHRITDPAEEVTFAVEFSYVSSAWYPRLDDAKARPLPADHDGRYLEERLPHIPFTPGIRAQVAEIVGDETNPLARARKIFAYIDGNIRYCAEKEYSVIPSFAKKAFETGRGDCGVQTMLFITMCRIAGIPARWQSGWQTQPSRWNLHDWAEVYVEPWGWLPMDVSYGLRDSDDPKVRYFYVGHQDSYRMIVNLDYGSPLHPTKESLRSEPADFQLGELELDGRNLYYRDEWTWRVSVDHERLDQ